MRAPWPGLRVVSACAGQGRDLLEVLAGAPQGGSVQAHLVELDRSSVATAQRAARDAGLAGVEVVCGDAGRTDAYLGAVPADLVLLCGVFGNISDGDVRRTVEHLPQLCAADATVIWTRSRRAPDLTPAIRGWLANAGFVEQSFDARWCALLGGRAPVRRDATAAGSRAAAIPLRGLTVGAVTGAAHTRSEPG